MQKRIARELYKKLEEILTDRAFLKEINLSKKSMLSLLTVSDYKTVVASMAVSEQITCSKVCALSTPALEQLSETPQEGWLAHNFNYTINQLFPEKNKIPTSKYKRGRLFLYKVLDFFLEFDRENRDFSPTLGMEFLKKDQLAPYPAGEEYGRFLDLCKENYIYPFMRIGTEITPYNTLGHVSGVHYVAMHVARQMEEAKVPIDLALISGAAATHDVGKFGCKDYESARIPYLHYYYTEECLLRNGMPLTAHIASNHSTWDLELENLSLESLLLIYSDFRVKSIITPDGEEHINFYTLDQAFEIILNKLDNVDEAKRARYQRVYQKLYDFEQYMKSLGVSTDLTNPVFSPLTWRDAALLSPKEAVERLKYLAIEHNIEVMKNFNSEVSFGTLLEDARSERRWNNIRAYVTTLQEYFTYMTQPQKQMTISFLFELLVHSEGDIRRKASKLVGNIIAKYDEKYTKELPTGAKARCQRLDSLVLWREYLRHIINPDLKVTDQQKRWMGYTLKITMEHLLESTEESKKHEYLNIFIEEVMGNKLEASSVFVVLDTMLSVSTDLYTQEDLAKLLSFVLDAFAKDPIEIKVSALRFVKRMATHHEAIHLTLAQREKILEMTNTKINGDTNASVIYLKFKIREAIGVNDNLTKCYKNTLFRKEGATSEIFRENLKVGTPWVIKAVNIELLLDELKHGKKNKSEVFYIAMHLSNLLKTSERVSVRHIAGEGLIEVFKLLNLDQRNEIVIELTKGLEIGEYQFSKYIPEYLGPLALTLHPEELDEMIYEFGTLLESTNDKVASVTLDTLGEILKKYHLYHEEFSESKAAFEQRKKKIIGMLLRGMANFHRQVSQEAFMVLGQYIFGTKELFLEDKYNIFKLLYKKMLTLIVDKKESPLTFFNNAAALNHIYRFISDYTFYNGKINLKQNKKIAFFPGTFDPFSLSHKGIVTSIRDMGYEVYLAIDEFSWSKKTQPRMIRRKIITMSIANESDVYVFPDNEPVNISNERDLKKLKGLFHGKSPYLVVGSDVIANASSYKVPPTTDSVHTLNHVVFKRDSAEQGGKAALEAYNEAKQFIQGELIELSLPTHLEDISSTRIRENIDSNR
ncbi:MAG: hypothetical protein RR626_07505, partial [Anaerovoracaceae bacterium]